MNKWELPKEAQFYNWESPITKIYGDIHNEIIRQDEENCTFAIEEAIGYRVDKDELIKALQYDRNQYDKGYNDGVKETFVEDLEKIKDEMKDLYLYSTNENSAENVFLLTKDLLISVIDEHINKLKED